MPETWVWTMETMAISRGCRPWLVKEFAGWRNGADAVEVTVFVLPPRPQNQPWSVRHDFYEF